ncbi:hypothetical protein [Thiofilum flexile]|uniref:hypothetical protein n=1 Tax=Thiofilum flexile TaxID=125627 RepID=UPI00036A7897|nr:hypothetical protein [Thiofilum flexile]
MEEYNPANTKALSLVEAIRKRPGMFFGEINSLAVNHAIYEVVANAVDQYLAGNATKVQVGFNEKIIWVSDDGPGLPYDKPSPDPNLSLAEFYFTHRHNSPTADNHAPHIHLVGGGLGLAAINAASEFINVTSSNGSSIWKQRFGKGKILGKASEQKYLGSSGTTLEFQLDREIFQGYSLDHFDLRKTMFELAHFYPRLIVEYQQERFIAYRGLLDLAYIHYRTPALADKLPIAFYFEGMSNKIQVQVATLGDSQRKTKYISWVNGLASVEGGTHVEGLQDAFKHAGWKPTLALIHIIMHDPKFAGPSRDVLRSESVKHVISHLLTKPIEEFRQAQS